MDSRACSSSRPCGKNIFTPLLSINIGIDEVSVKWERSGRPCTVHTLHTRVVQLWAQLLIPTKGVCLYVRYLTYTAVDQNSSVDLSDYLFGCHLIWASSQLILPCLNFKQLMSKRFLITLKIHQKLCLIWFWFGTSFCMLTKSVRAWSLLDWSNVFS